MLDVNNQRQLIGSLGASTEFADNVGGMGLGHPGVPHMSSGVSGIPGEYSGHGGFGHGWDGESPIEHDNGWGYGGSYGGGHGGGHGGGYGGLGGLGGFGGFGGFGGHKREEMPSYTAGNRPICGAVN